MKKILREYLPLALALLCMFAARSTLADHYLVPSGSMERTLLPGDHVIVDKHAYGLRIPFTLYKLTPGSRPARGEVVVFDSPVDGRRLIKRVVAVAGDLLEIRNGYVYVNGVHPGDARERDVENFGQRTALLNLDSGGGPDVAPTRVPPGHVFVAGDARGNSADSRYFGFIAERAVYARAVAVFFRTRDGLVWQPL